MSKLFSLKAWVTLPDAAAHLSAVFGESVAEADVLQLALDGHLTLSVHFVNHTRANPGRIVPADEIGWTELPPISNDENAPPIHIPDGLHIEGGRWVKLERRIVTLDGIWDLPMIGSEALDVEHEYQRLTNGPSVTLVGIEGAFVQGESGVMCRLCESFDDNEFEPGSSARLRKLERQELINAMTPEEAVEIREKFKLERTRFCEKMKSMDEHNRYYPAAGLPADSVLVVRTSNLTSFIQRVSESPEREARPLSNKERESLQKQIGALALLLAEKNGRYKKSDGPNANAIADDVTAVLAGRPNAAARGVSHTSLRDSIKAGIGLLEG